ncbi:MAG: N-acyl homoserine lactonase family protein [Halanaeroarchaeum sp.]
MTDISLTVVERGQIRSDARQVIEGYRYGTRDEPNPETVMGSGPVYAVVIDHSEATVLWDTGPHPAAANGHWSDDQLNAFEYTATEEDALEPALGRNGYALEDIDVVVQSHLHMDHAGGLFHFADTDVPVYVHEEELAHAYVAAQTDRGDDWYIAGDFHHDLKWRLISENRYPLFEGIELLHLPGHTPGLMGAVVDLGDETVVVIGDQADIKLNYEAGIPMSGSMLWNKAAWERSHRQVKAIADREDALVVAGHDEEDLEQLRAL